MHRHWTLPVLLLAILTPIPAGAGVVGSSASGFLVRNEVAVAAAPDSVYRSLTGHIDAWWDPDHTWSGDARNLSLDARPGGCFCETLPGGGGVRHLEVVYAAPGKLLRLVGALGPLQASGLAGSLTWTLEAAADSTRLAVAYAVGGYFEGNVPPLAGLVDQVLGSQLLRLKAFVETGRSGSR